MTRSGRLSRSEVAKLPTGSSHPELLLAVQMYQAGIGFEREYHFAPEDWCLAHGFVTPTGLPRKFRADFMVEQGVDVARVRVVSRLLIEVEGGAWVNGRHSRGAGMEADCEKSALAAIRGYRVMRVTPAQVSDGRALSWIRQALGLEKAA